MTQEEREMKANEAPEKIYINSSLEDRIWLIGKGDTSFIEYTRTDAFIEKACEFLSNAANIPLWENYDDTFDCDTIKLIDNFRNYMKGE